MVQSRHNSYFFASAIAVGLGVACAVAQVGVTFSSDDHLSTEDNLRVEIAKLRLQNQTLASSLIETKENEAKSAEELVEIKQRLAALGKNLLDGGSDRLVQAAIDIQVLQERLTAVETAALNISAASQNYSSLAVVSDPSARLKLEVSLRELDNVLGLTDKPRPDIKTGSIQRAEVVSIDSESGLILINAGISQNLQIGMNYSLQRGALNFGKAVIAEVRSDVSGAFVEQLTDKNQQVQIGDSLVLNTEAR